MATSKIEQAMATVDGMPKMDIKGKSYTQVASRVEAFRRVFGLDMAIVTEVLDAYDPELCRVKASIVTAADGKVLATGHAQEDRRQNKINAVSALEVAETSAIGRALAALGLMGGEYASSFEMEAAGVAPSKMAGESPEQFRQKVAEHFPPAVNQYTFVVPVGVATGDVNTVFEQIDRIADQTELTAYFKALEEWMQWLNPQDADEVKATFKYRSNQLKG